MPGFDRSKLKATAANVIQQQEKNFSKGGFDKNYLSIEVGHNKVRIYPYHPEKGGNSFAEMKSVSYLEVTKPKRGEDKKIIEGEFEVKRSPIFNGRVHGGMSMDLVEQYIDFAKKVAIPNFTDDKATVDKILERINGNAKTKINGISPQDSWVVYASVAQGRNEDGTDKWSPVGLLELKKSVKTLMTEKAAELNTPDPFSDADEGIAIIITRAKESLTPSGWYKVRLDKVTEKAAKGMTENIVFTPLTQEQIDKWIDLKSLYELYVGTYTRKDFDAQLEGLQNFDAQLAKDGFPIGVFAYDDFLDIVEKLSDEAPLEVAKEENNGDEAFHKSEKIKDAPKVAEQPKAAPSRISRPAPKAPEPAKVETKAEPVPAHIASTQSKLDLIRARAGKK